MEILKSLETIWMTRASQMFEKISLWKYNVVRLVQNLSLVGVDHGGSSVDDCSDPCHVAIRIFLYKRFCSQFSAKKNEGSRKIKFYIIVNLMG